MPAQRKAGGKRGPIVKEILFFDKCFWCLEDFCSYLDGVVATEVGYANGNPDIVPEYYEVGRGETGYEEVARVFYDEEKISLEEICTQFLEKLNPRKVYSDEEKLLRENQSKIIYVDHRDAGRIEAVKAAVEERYGNQLLTVIEPLHNYYTAEEEHQHYYKKHPEDASCPRRS